jgi:uncharacterized membrane protein
VTAIRAALVIGIVRIAALWTSVRLMEASDVWQVVGNGLLLVTCLPEAALASRLRFNGPAWTVFVTGLIAATSLALGYAWARIFVDHPRSTERKSF